MLNNYKIDNYTKVVIIFFFSFIECAKDNNLYSYDEQGRPLIPSKEELESL